MYLVQNTRQYGTLPEIRSVT